MTGRGEWMSRPPTKGPQFELVEVSWQMRSQQTPPRTIECGIYRVNHGFEVRTTYQPDNRIYSQRVLDIRRARELAARLRYTVIAWGGFEDLPAIH